MNLPATSLDPPDQAQPDPLPAGEVGGSVPAAALIELRGVKRYYRMGQAVVKALDGVDLTIREGEFVAIIGPSGSGKSTMMHLLGCLDRPTAGTYRFAGQEVSRLGDRQLARVRNRSIGFVFQTFNLISRMSAWENVAVPLFYARRTITRPDALAALDGVGLGLRANHQPNELSGGERQRVAIARAIINRPKLILADEPTGNLDTRTGEQIIAIFRRLHEGGTTIILVTHEPEVARQAERIVSMRDGKIISDGPNPDHTPKPRASACATVPPGFERPWEKDHGLAKKPDRATQLEYADAANPAMFDGARKETPAARGLWYTLTAWAAMLVWGQIAPAIKSANPLFTAVVGGLIVLSALAMIVAAPLWSLITVSRRLRHMKRERPKERIPITLRLVQAGGALLVLIALLIVAMAIAGVMMQMQKSREAIG